MNRPLYKPCWVVFTYVGGEAGVSKGHRYYMGHPAVPDQIRCARGKTGLFANYDGVFNVGNVEPFLDELEAIAAAVLVDGCVDRYEPGKQWPVGMTHRYYRNEQAKDEGCNGGRRYEDE